MRRKTSQQNFVKVLVGCASSVLAIAPAFSMPSLGDTDYTSISDPTSFQAAVERLHHDLLIGDCRSTNPEIHRCLDVLADREASSSERCAAAARLGGLKFMAQSSLLPLVRIFSAETDYSVKSAVGVALVRISPDVAVLQILPGIESRDDDFRQMCVATLASGGKDVVSPLVRALKCPDANIRRQSAMALSELGATAIAAVNVLREISSNIDEKSLFAEEAARSASSIKRDYDEKTGPDVTFNSQNWKDENSRQYRFRMIHDLMESRILIGLHAAQMHDILGQGVSFFKGTQFRYALGARGIGSKQRNCQSTYSHRKRDSNEQTMLSARVSIGADTEQFLVVNLKDDVVTNCELVTFDPDLWNVNNLDRTSFQDSTSQKPLTVLAAAYDQLRR